MKIILRHLGRAEQKYGPPTPQPSFCHEDTEGDFCRLSLGDCVVCTDSAASQDSNCAHTSDKKRFGFGCAAANIFQWHYAAVLAECSFFDRTGEEPLFC